MRFKRLCLFVSFAILSLCNAADAGAVLQVGGSVSGGAFDGLFDTDFSDGQQVGKPMSCNVPMCQDSKLLVVEFPQDSVDLAIDGEASFGQGIAVAHPSAHARAGDLGINIVAGAGAGADRAFAEFATSEINASWIDTVTVNTGKVAFGKFIDVKSFLSLDGELIGSANGEGDVAAFLQLFDLSSIRSLPPAPFGSDIWADVLESPSGGIHELNEIPGAIRLQNVFRNGVGSTLGYRMSVTGSGSSDTNNNGINLQAAKPGSATFVANISGSLH